MELSNPNPQKFKVIIDSASGTKWVKELVDPFSGSKEAIRHNILTGPNGGEYFIDSKGR